METKGNILKNDFDKPKFQDNKIQWGGLKEFKFITRISHLFFLTLHVFWAIMINLKLKTNT